MPITGFYLVSKSDVFTAVIFSVKNIKCYYRPPGGGRLFDMKIVRSYVFLGTYYV